MNDKVDLRALALETLLLTEKEGVKLNETVNAVLEKYAYLPKEKRAFYARLTEGTFEQLILLDHIIDLFSKTPTKKMKPVIRNILRLSVYQIREMDVVPDRAAVNEAVKLAEKKGFRSLKGFVNGVLRSIIREADGIKLPEKEDSIKYISIKYSMPEFIVRQWIRAYGADATERICRAFLEDKHTTVRIRGGVDRVQACILSLEEAGAEVKKAPYPSYAYYISCFDRLDKLEAFKNGSLAVQDISSMLAVEAAGIRGDETVLDVCAAPGGKSMLAADKALNGRVISRDISEKKLELIRENVRRCGIENIEIQHWDAAVYDPSLEEAADVVFVDAPCSGYGVIGRKSDIKYQAGSAKQSALAELQKKILCNAAKYVRRGGRLIYSTCTISAEENEDNVRSFLKEQPFKSYDLTKYLPGDFKNTTAENGYIQILPGEYPCDGFFIAGFIKE